MATRKPLSKKVRFEVLKRDSFKCQYCGESAPNVTLEVDHIIPVAKGGTNEIVNLVTACKDCNSGKSDRELSDDSVVVKQKAQLDELNERRNQLQLIAEWREELLTLEAESVALICKEYAAITGGYSVLKLEEKQVFSWVRKYRLPDILEAVRTSAAQYLSYEKSGHPTNESLDKAFAMIPRILNVQTNVDKSFMKDLYYIRGIMRNRFNYVNENFCMEYLKTLYEKHQDIEVIKKIVFSCNNWTEFTEYVD